MYLSNTQDINLILSQARRKISKFCLERCLTTCCENLTIITDNKEDIEAILQIKIPKIVPKRIQKKHPNLTIDTTQKTTRYILNLNPCNQLDLQTGKCNIYNTHKPKACDTFPIEVRNNSELYIHNSCQAIQFGIINKEIKLLKTYNIPTQQK